MGNALSKMNEPDSLQRKSRRRTMKAKKKQEKKKLTEQEKEELKAKVKKAKEKKKAKQLKAKEKEEQTRQEKHQAKLSALPIKKKIANYKKQQEELKAKRGKELDTTALELGSFFNKPQRKRVDILEGVDIDKEYELIQKKQSNLSFTQRRVVISRYNKKKDEELN